MNTIKYTRYLFGTAYIFLIISSLELIRQSNTYSNVAIGLRASILLIIFSLCAAKIIRRLSTRIEILILGLILLPYIFSDAYLSYIDLFTITLVSSTIQKSSETHNYLNKLASISLITIIIIVIFAKIGIIPSKEFEWHERIKNSLGFHNPNTLYYFILSAAYVYYITNSKRKFIACGIIMLILYPWVESRTFFISYCLLVPFAIKRGILSNKLIIFLLWVWLLISITLGLITSIFPTESSILLSALSGVDVNELLSNRLELISQNTARSTLSWILGGLSNTADSLYVYMLNGFGFIGLFLFLLISIYSIYKKARLGNRDVLPAACIFFTIGLLEEPLNGSALIAAAFILSIFYHYQDNQSPQIKH